MRQAERIKHCAKSAVASVFCAALLSAVPTAAGSALAATDIGAGPIRNPANGHNYYLLAQDNWTNSEARAVTLGGHLVTINDAAEDTWVDATFSQYGGPSQSLWIGLTDQSVEGTFVWTSGEPVSYTHWGPGEPNDHEGIEDWAHVLPLQDSRYPAWNDAPDRADSFGFVFRGVVEVVPEPGALALFAICSAVLPFARPRNLRAASVI